MIPWLVIIKCENHTRSVLSSGGKNWNWCFSLRERERENHPTLIYTLLPQVPSRLQKGRTSQDHFNFPPLPKCMQHFSIPKGDPVSWMNMQKRKKRISATQSTSSGQFPSSYIYSSDDSKHNLAFPKYITSSICSHTH